MTATMLTWRHSSDDVIEAPSARPVEAPFTGAHYTIEYDSGFRPGRPDADASYLLTYVLEDVNGDADETDFGRYPRRRAAKKAADRHERTGERPAAREPWTPAQQALVTEALAAIWTVPGTTPAAAARAVLTVLAQAGHIRD